MGSLGQVSRPVDSSGMSICCLPVSLESQDSYFSVYPGLPVYCVTYLYSSATGTGASSATSSEYIVTFCH